MISQSNLYKCLSLSALLLSSAAVHAGLILSDDFNNGNVRDPEVYSGGATANFWTNAGSESGGQFEAVVANTSGFTGRNLNSVALTDAWEFFNQEITLSVRGINFTDTSTNGKSIPLANMQTFFGFGSSGSTAWAADDGISLQVRPNGGYNFRLSSDQPNNWGTNIASQTGVNGINGFDLTLGPGTTGVDYRLTIFNDDADIVNTGNLAIEQGDWDSAIANTSRFSIQVQESVNPAVDPEQEFTFNIDSLQISTIPEPTSAHLLGCGLMIVVALRRFYAAR